MSKRLSRVSLLTSSLALFLAACGGGGGGIEGKYYNQNGAFVMELKGGKVSMAPGMEAMNANYEVHGDSVVLKDPSGGSEVAVLMRQKDGTLDGGMLEALKRR